MNYEELVTSAKGYTDRYDAELAAMFPAFFRVVESHINVALKTTTMSTRAQIWLERNQEYYALPDDFAGMVDIEILPQGSASISLVNASAQTSGRTLRYCSPEEMNARARDGSTNWYSIIANQLQVAPPGDNEVLEMVYMQTLKPIVPNSTNWLATKHPDVYIFGLCAEISAFAKDGQAFQTWDARFNGALQNIQSDDTETTWSGPPMSITIDGMTP